MGRAEMNTRPYRAKDGPPPANVADAMSAPGPMTRRQRMDNLNITPDAKLTPDDIRKLNPVLEPVSGEEVGMQKREEKVYKKKMAAGGSASSRADGCAQRGKTRGTFV